MKLYEFKSLDEMDQIEIIWNTEALAARIENGYSIFLFQVDAFYVELYYPVGKDWPEKIRSFASTEHLEAYLEQINIEALLA